MALQAADLITEAISEKTFVRSQTRLTIVNGAMAGTWLHVVLHTCHAFFAARNWQMGGMHFKKTTEWLLLQLDSTLQAHTTRVDLHLGHGRAHIAQAVTWPP